MRQLLRVTAEKSSLDLLEPVYDARIAVAGIVEKYGSKPDIEYIALGEDYALALMQRGLDPSGELAANWWRGGWELIGHRVVMDTDLPKRALQVVWTR